MTPNQERLKENKKKRVGWSRWVVLGIFLNKRSVTFAQEANFWDNKNKGGTVKCKAEKEDAENQTFKNDTKKNSGVKVSGYLQADAVAVSRYIWNLQEKITGILKAFTPVVWCSWDSSDAEILTTRWPHNYSA